MCAVPFVMSPDFLCRVSCSLSKGILLRDGAAELAAERLGLSAIDTRKNTEREGEQAGRGYFPDS